MKHFINETADLVQEAITGALLADPSLVRLDGYPAIKVVLRADWDRSKVAVISGGGAGHEPAHVGFVGRGMLTAAVSGELFASPSVDAVLAAILAVTGEAGCLLIVKNYTGDRLSFGLARERARALGKRVEMVIVADDIAIKDAENPRGIAGTLFVHKVAGHAAEAGVALREVLEAAELAAQNVASIGISLSSCTIPGRAAETRMTDEEAELGLGIHGEPGIEKIRLSTAKDLVDEMVKRVARALETIGSASATASATASASRLAVLVNNLGGVPALEMSVITKAVLESELGASIALVVGPAALMTSLDMKGFSLSFLRLNVMLEEALLSEVAPTHWTRATRARRPAAATIPMPDAPRRRVFVSSKDSARRQIVETVCRALIAKETELDALDAKVGDGDTGSTCATAARSIMADLDSLPFADMSGLALALSDKLATVMGGSSGVLLSIFLAATGNALSDKASRNAVGNVPRALLSGLSRVQEVGGAQLGDRTMIDALHPALTALAAGASLSQVATAAREGAEKTGKMERARAGRASYLSAASLRGVMDPGAAGRRVRFQRVALRARAVRGATSTRRVLGS